MPDNFRFDKDVPLPDGRVATRIIGPNGAVLLDPGNRQQQLIAQRFRAQGGPPGLQAQGAPPVSMPGGLPQGAPPVAMPGPVVAPSPGDKMAAQALLGAPSPALQAGAHARPAPAFALGAPPAPDPAQVAAFNQLPPRQSPFAQELETEPVRLPTAAAQAQPGRGDGLSIPMRFVPGRRGSPGGWVDRQRRQQELGSPESQQAMADARKAEAEAVLKQQDLLFEEQEVQREERYTQALDTSLALEGELKETREREERIRYGVEERMNIVSDRLEETDIEVDPNRYWKGEGGGWRKAKAIISSMIGGYLAGKRGGPNRALERIDRLVSDDIRQQEREHGLALGRHKEAKNAYSDYLKLHGSPEAARQNVKAVMMRQAAMDVEREAAARGIERLSPGQQAARATLLAGFQTQEAQAMDAIAREAFGTVTQQNTPRVAATRGGVRPLTLKELKEENLYRTELEKRAGVFREAPKESPTKPFDERVTEYANRLQQAQVPEYNSAIQQVYDEIAAARAGDPEADIPGVGGTAWTPKFWLTDQGKRVRQAVLNLSDVMLRDRTGAVIADSERSEFSKILGDGTFGSDEQLLTGLAILKRKTDAVSSNLGRGYGAEVVDEYNRRNTSRSAVQAGGGQTLQFQAIE